MAVSADSATSRSDGAACGGVAPKLTVQGTGMASGTPNVLTVSVGIDVTDPSAQASLADDDSKASAVTAALKRGGVLEKEFKPRTCRSNLSTTAGARSQDMRSLILSRLSCGTFSSAGSVIDALAEAAGRRVRMNSLSFSIEDSRGIENQAAYRRRAPSCQPCPFDGSSGWTERLGPVCSLTDNSSVSDASPDDFGPLSAAASPVPVEPGTQQASAQVTMVLLARMTGAGIPAKE